jgi:hypothetical protein
LVTGVSRVCVFSCLFVVHFFVLLDVVHFTVWLVIKNFYLRKRAGRSR